MISRALVVLPLVYLIARLDQSSRLGLWFVVCGLTLIVLSFQSQRRT